MKRLAILASIVLMLAIGSTANAATPPFLGRAGSFVVLAGSKIANTGTTTLNGDIGLFPGLATAITGFPPGLVTGINHAGDAVTQQAKVDLVNAYNDVAGQGPFTVEADLTGLTLLPGVYHSASSLGLLGVNGNLTLDGGGSTSSVFIFQAGSDLTTATGSSVSLINGARACNVYWQVGSSATLGTGSTFRGTILALTSITVTTGVTIFGRALARNGAVTLDTDTITPDTSCGAVAGPTGTPMPATATPAPTATPSTPTATPSTPTTTPTVQTATPARIVALPSTSTSADLPLGAISVVLIAIGGAMLLIRRTRTSTD